MRHSILYIYLVAMFLLCIIAYYVVKDENDYDDEFRNYGD